VKRADGASWPLHGGLGRGPCMHIAAPGPKTVLFFGEIEGVTVFFFWTTQLSVDFVSLNQPDFKPTKD